MRTWIINIPVDLREYCVENGEVKHYLAVNKQTDFILQGDIAILWGGRHSKFPGILGYGIILTEPIKPTEIPKKYRKLYDKGSLQIGFRPIHLSYETAHIPQKYAYQFPSLNETKQPTRINNKTAYWGWWLFSEIQLVFEDYPHLFKFGNYNDGHFNFVIHLLRERYFTGIDFRKFNTKLTKTLLVCNYCNTDFEKTLGRETSLRIMELHEEIEISDGDYKKIKAENFKMTCPTCHKIEHDKIRKREL